MGGMIESLLPSIFKGLKDRPANYGSEFRVAFEEARAYGGKVILGDQPLELTIKRTWAKMPPCHKMELVFSTLFGRRARRSEAFKKMQKVLDDGDTIDKSTLMKLIKEMDDADATIDIQDMSKEYPTLWETLVHERDQYMSSKLLEVASKHGSVVAIVGKGHLPGIKKLWKQPPVELREILEMPSKKAGVSAIKVISLGVAAASAVIICSKYEFGI